MGGKLDREMVEKGAEEKEGGRNSGKRIQRKQRRSNVL